MDALLKEDFEKLKNWKPFPRLVCQDGFSISVQANAFAYCIPKSWDGPYTHLECGFPSEKEPDLMEWAEDYSNPTGTVYAHVPSEVVKSVLKKHGGVIGYIEDGQTILFKEPFILLS